MPRSFLIANKRYGRGRLDRRSQLEELATGSTCDTQQSSQQYDEEGQSQEEILPCISPHSDSSSQPESETSIEAPSVKHNTALLAITTGSGKCMESIESKYYHYPMSISDTVLHKQSYNDEEPVKKRPCGYPHILQEGIYYGPLMRSLLPTPEMHLFHSLPFSHSLPQHPVGYQTANFGKDLNFNHLNEFVDNVFDGLSMGDIFACNVCGKQYSTPSNLARHKQIHRDVTDKKARKCPHCDKVYVSMPAFSMHVRTHNEGCACPYCGKRFSRPWLLQGHIRTHTGEKPFSCSLCPKAFADKSNLRAHIQTHSTEKPYSCGRCGKAFALKSYLSKHEESSCMKGLKYHKLSCAFTQRTH